MSIEGPINIDSGINQEDQLSLNENKFSVDFTNNTRLGESIKGQRVVRETGASISKLVQDFSKQIDQETYVLTDEDQGESLKSAKKVAEQDYDEAISKLGEEKNRLIDSFIQEGRTNMRELYNDISSMLDVSQFKNSLPEAGFMATLGEGEGTLESGDYKKDNHAITDYMSGATRAEQLRNT